VLTQPAPTSVFQPVDGTSGIIGGVGDGVDRYRIASTKTLEYWSALALNADSLHVDWIVHSI